jgi:archaellum component FlaC
MNLDQARKKLNEAKQARAEAEGALKQLTQQLKDDFGVKDLSGGKKKLEEIRTEMETLNQEITEKMTELEELLS